MDRIKKSKGMDATLFIKLSRTNNEKVEWLLSINNDTAAQGSLAALSEVGTLRQYAVDSEIVLIIPGEVAVFHTISIPGTGKVKLTKKILNALPYWLEGKIVGEIESLEWVLVTTQAPFSLLGVGKDLLREWDNAFTEAQLPLHRILPDMLCLPVPDDGEWSCVPDGERWIIRQDAGSGMVMDNHWLTALINNNQIKQVVKVYGNDECTDIPLGWRKISSGSALENLAINSKNAPVNLLQKPGGLRERRLFAGFAPTLILAGALSVTLCAWIFFSACYQQYTAEKMERQSQQLYQTLVHNKKQVKNPKYRLMQILKNSEEKQSSNKLLALMSQLAKASEFTKGVIIEEIIFENKTGSLYIATNPESLQKIRAGLTPLSVKVSENLPDEVKSQPARIWLKMELTP